MAGRVYFIGAGPGAPDLITVRGRDLVATCPVILYAGSLVNPAILDWAREDAAIHDSNHLTLEEQVEVMRTASAAGKDVARLHTGDPSIYGAIGEQMAELEQHGIAYEVVPGVSSCFAAAAALKQELTLPGVTQSIVLTRRSGRTKVPEKEALPVFAAATPTLMLFLSAGEAPGLVADLAPHYGDDCPVAVVYRASWPDQKVVRCALAELPEALAAADILQQAMIIVSPVFGAPVKRSHLYGAEAVQERRAP